MMITLRSYQVDAARWLLERRRGVLADEVGLGKTFPAVYAGELSRGSAPALVVAPAYLLRQWAEAIQKVVGDVRVNVLERRHPPPDPDRDDWVVTSYHTLLNDGVRKHPELLSTRWPVVIFDEAHRLRGRNTQWTRNAHRLRATNLWMLTGTPFVNNPSDIWPLLKLCDARAFSSYWRFVGEWCQSTQTPWATEIGGLRPRSEEAFNEMLQPYFLRRLIADHLPELPPLIEHRIPIDLTPTLRKAHDVAKRDWFIEHPDLDDAIAITSGGALVAKLRQLTMGYAVEEDAVRLVARENPKLAAVRELLDDHPNEPIVVFSWYVGSQQLIRSAISGRPVFEASGRSSPKQRAESVEAWKRTPNGVLVATLAALQEGANLQHARMLVFVEHDFLPTTIEQATARVRRFGQEYPVHAYHLYATRTIDESVLRVAATRARHNTRALLEDLRGEAFAFAA